MSRNDRRLRSPVRAVRTLCGPCSQNSTEVLTMLHLARYRSPQPKHKLRTASCIKHQIVGRAQDFGFLNQRASD